ncbi:MAG TPA: 1,4-alpha-glucan branching protein GlgB [Candidatus Binatia bacterium]|nr:1,4-alpha-glucan branching protein GlgB [Candidatus Binatia bacterium]
MTTLQRPALAADCDRLAAGTHHDPHRVLGPHPADGSVVVRLWHPDVTEAEVAYAGGVVAMRRIDGRGLFEATVPVPELPGYRLRCQSPVSSWEMDDPYRFWPTLGELDLHLIGEGHHRELWRRLGARVIEHQGVTGVAFAVWAPNARGVSLVSDANGWDGRVQPMRALGSTGVWELFVPGIGAGTCYKFRVTGAGARRVDHADPLARWAEVPPRTASIVEQSRYSWGDADWLRQRARRPLLERPLSVYEVHLGSWRRTLEGEALGYRDLAAQLADYCVEMGFTHIELMPVSEHPYSGSWGYQVTSYYAPTSRFGPPDDFRFFVDHLHRRGIGVIVDWVPAHFPRDEWALARFDGTGLYEHIDPRRGEHPDWGTLVFNYGRNEVRNFLLANARYWVEEFHIDGLRVDAVASMLYLDYSRRAGQWLPNRYGGRENLEAISLLREFNELIHGDFPGVITAAEESTAWPGVSRPTVGGGLGFTFKWNMGWMHDTLEYFSKDPVFRRYHHHQLTFAFLYAWSENFILPLSHDEVVHGKGSLIGKMPGDRWQQFANLRALLGWMWAHPGKKLLFMSDEFGQYAEWSHEHSIDWHLLEHADHRGVQRLVKDLGARYREIAALWERDHGPEGFRWIDAGNADQNVLSFARYDAGGRPGLVCVANLSPVTHHGYRVGMPLPGRWREVLNTDSQAYEGSNQGNQGGVTAGPEPWHGLPWSAAMTLPPLAVVWLVLEGE